jgi:hypothetical protein
MLQWILSALSAPVFNTIVEAYKAKLASANERDKLAVDLAVKEIEAGSHRALRRRRSSLPGRALVDVDHPSACGAAGGDLHLEGHCLGQGFGLGLDRSAHRRCQHLGRHYRVFDAHASKPG